MRKTLNHQCIYESENCNPHCRSSSRSSGQGRSSSQQHMYFHQLVDIDRTQTLQYEPQETQALICLLSERLAPSAFIYLRIRQIRSSIIQCYGWLRLKSMALITVYIVLCNYYMLYCIFVMIYDSHMNFVTFELLPHLSQWCVYLVINYAGNYVKC